MSMEEILDSVRRIINKWVNTSSPLISNISVGDTQININSTIRFQAGDQVMLRDVTIYETGLIIDTVDDNNFITFTSSVLNNWAVGQETILVKTVDEHFVQGIYIGDPDVIPMYPAITVNGISRSSEWMTLESTKERYEIEVGIFVKAATHESGYRFLLNITDLIQKGLKRNIVPLINDYNIMSLNEDISRGDIVIKVSDRDKLIDYKRIIIEDEFETQEIWVEALYEDSEGSILLREEICCTFLASNTSIIVPKRFIYNSWPAEITYGSVHKGTLLKGAIIKWFAEEEEMQFFRRNELKLN